MASFHLLVALLLLKVSTENNSTNQSLDDKVTECVPTYQKTIYQYNMTTLDGDFIPLSRFQNTIVLIVNVASFSQYTLQYLQLNELMKKYGIDNPQRTIWSNETDFAKNESSLFKSCHLQILGFPSSLFHREEPGIPLELKNCLYYVRPGNGFVPAFPLSMTIDVNGQDETPLYSFLKENCSTNANISNETCTLWSPIKNNDIVWSFEKILIDHLGYPAYRFQPMVEPFQLSDHIEMLMKRCEEEVNENKILDTIELFNSKYEHYLPLNTRQKT